MYKNNGCGIAAPQVGVLKRIIVIDCDQEDGRQDPITLINPEILELKGEFVTEEEGCLSCPGISVPECRREYAVVKFTDFDGEDYIIEGDGLLGRCLQHEIDHLNGKTLFESAAPAARLKALRDYEIARAAAPSRVKRASTATLERRFHARCVPGNPDFAASILIELKEQHDVVAVYTRADAVRGRRSSCRLQ